MSPPALHSISAVQWRSGWRGAKTALCATDADSKGSLSCIGVELICCLACVWDMGCDWINALW